MTASRALRATALGIVLALALAPASAATLRFSSQGDITTIDPHGNNEGFTNAYLDNIYETLVTRGKDLKVEPCLALSWQNVTRPRCASSCART
jgi:peptide/nickel transport system substrate-binding protein